MSTPDEVIMISAETAHESGDMKELIKYIKLYKNIANRETITIAMNLINELASEELENMTI